MSAPPRLTVLVPVRDEDANILPLVEEIEAALDAVVEYEILYVNDGSADGTEGAVLRAAEGRPRLRLIALDANSGKAAALRAGAAAARGELLVLIDGDGQNNPADIPRLLVAFDATPGAGLAMAQRVGRKDTAFKRWQSRSANAIRKRLLADDTRDAGCGFALLPRAVFRSLPFFAGIHRFLPALVRREGLGVAFVEVVDRPRRSGVSKYGFFDRLWVGITDMFGVLWLIRRRGRVATAREVTAQDHGTASLTPTAAAGAASPAAEGGARRPSADQTMPMRR